MPQETTSRANTRRDRFVRVAARRTQRVLEAIRKLAKCANRSAYQYSQSDVQKIFVAIERELGDARVKFDARDERKEATFSFE